MKRIIVADTSPLITLAKLQQLTLLESTFASVHVPLNHLLAQEYRLSKALVQKVLHTAGAV